MDKRKNLIVLVDNAVKITENYLSNDDNEFRRELCTGILKDLNDMNTALHNDVLPKGINMFGFTYICSDFPEVIPAEIKKHLSEITQFYREVYSK